MQSEGKPEGNSANLAAIEVATAGFPEAIRAAILALVAACQPASGKAKGKAKRRQ